MNISISEYRNLVRGGLYALLNEKSKEVYIGHTTNFMIALERSISQITRGISTITEYNTPGAEITFVLLETEEDFYTKLLHHNHYCNSYSDLGYKVLNKREAIDLTCKVSLEEDEEVPLILVTLVNRNTKILVGVFQNIEEAKEFQSLYYPNKKIENIVYASNQLTKDYINTH